MLSQVVVQDPVIILLAEGDDAGSQANARGHLFESFMARVMHQLGYKEPTQSKLNVRADGFEVDISAQHDLNDAHAVAECKALATNINVNQATAFYGRLTALRFKQTNLDGFLFAIPRLTADAAQFVESVRKNDPRFFAYTAGDIWDLLQRRGLTDPISGENVSDQALVVHSSGIYCAAIELDPETRTGRRIVVNAKNRGGVPDSVLRQLDESDYARGLPVVAYGASTSAPVSGYTAPVIVEVHGSGSDFEYQLPASPKYFVGRRDAVNRIEDKVAHAGGPFVLNAQSGWGKSSLALKVASTVEGVGLVFDTRTAGAPTYVAGALRHAALTAQVRGLVKLPADATWATTEGALATIDRAEWSPDKRILVIFDQFENVFTDTALTAEFRDVALWTSENRSHITVGFAWKTDYVDWIETHPFRLRDQIREVATVVTLQPFGSAEVDTILRRLEQAGGVALSRELRQRLREYSQGLPWLLKKLTGHLLGEFKRGKTQEQLISEALNVQDLFVSDLAGLSPGERECLNFVARFAPAQASEVTERFQASLVQSLLNQRLVVQVGEKLDTYWDIFRDYLNTGRVPIEDSYILRQSPNSVARLVSELLAQGGGAATSAIAESWDTTENVVWNTARELRQLGLARSESGRVDLIAEIAEAVDSEREIRTRVARALRRHKAWTIFIELAERGQGRVAASLFARRLQEAFPAVSGTTNTWVTYARTFLAWCAYAGLALPDANAFILAPDGSSGVGSLTTKTPATIKRGVFPTLAPGPAIDILSKLQEDPSYQVPREKRKYLTQLVTLGALVASGVSPGEYRVAPGLFDAGVLSTQALRQMLEGVPGGRDAIAALTNDSGLRAVAAGAVFEGAYNASWTDSTKDLVGRSFFGWARAAGLSTRRGSREK
ncbi:nSTAND1 domain-containing NTPase [Cellulomonas phragmiteti]|uniref:Restriction endonuclease type IV Mrr domain-containing protein n=1 Tax=Cellulomonas phragmiteti TaxID=478780 RepID=A0ABQ4DIQ2_9CELL|nr:restriction endonuclease [Cellulomonas phragmiteti]GIG39235.1 hypothetical protein Cph01nite_09970 [Cellulomonas phragmiteti]